MKSDNCRRCETREERERLLARLLAAWDAVPALRLGQLIRNSVPITGRGNEIFAVEDADLITQVETFVKGHKSAP